MPRLKREHDLLLLTAALFLAAAGLFGWRMWTIAHKRVRPDAWTDVQARGRLLVGTDPTFMPFSGYAGDYTGLEPEIMREVARRLGVEIQFFAHGGDGLYEALDVGQVDVLAGQVVIDPKRTGLYRYSAPYYDAGQVLVVPAGTEAIDLASFAGGRVAVELGSEGDAVARRAQTVDPLLLIHTADPASALDAVAAGAADAAIVDHLSAQEVLRERPGFQILRAPVTSEPYALVTRFSSPELARRLQEALLAMQADGTLDLLYREWLP